MTSRKKICVLLSNLPSNDAQEQPRGQREPRAGAGTPHPAPRIPHLAPCTPHPAPGTLHLAPRTPHLAPGTSHPGPPLLAGGCSVEGRCGAVRGHLSAGGGRSPGAPPADPGPGCRLRCRAGPRRWGPGTLPLSPAAAGRAGPGRGGRPPQPHWRPPSAGALNGAPAGERFPLTKAPQRRRRGGGGGAGAGPGEGGGRRRPPPVGARRRLPQGSPRVGAHPAPWAAGRGAGREAGGAGRAGACCSAQGGPRSSAAGSRLPRRPLRGAHTQTGAHAAVPAPSPRRPSHPRPWR